MHVQPEAAKIEITNKPLWAPGAPEAIEKFIATRSGEVRVLEFGSGGSTMFLLGSGAAVTTVEHHALWAAALQQEAEARNLATRLTILRRDRPYDSVSAEFSEATKFDILLVDGRERIDCLRKALPFVKSDGLVLLDDSQRPRYWPAFSMLAKSECVTYESKARNTTIWDIGSGEADPDFIHKAFVQSKKSLEPKVKDLFLPKEFLDGSGIDEKYSKRTPIDNLKPVALDLQRIGLIERYATFISPKLYELRNGSLRIEGGRKFLNYQDVVFREKSGEYNAEEGASSFQGVIRLKGRTLDLTSAGAGLYSFFLLDALPKLEILGVAGLALKDFDAILVNSGAHWVRDILSWVFEDYKPNVVSFSKAQPSFHMERSTHIEGVRSARFTPRWVHSYLERLFKAHKQRAGGGEEATFGPFVYISRQKANGRRILNHDDFLDLIASFGFVEVFAEDYSPSQLARKLEDARVVISPHGAGLANIIFCPRSAKVIELFSSHFTPQYLHLARDMGQDHVALPCVDARGLNVFDRYDKTSKNKSEFNREDIVVPLDALRTALAHMC